MNIIGIHGIDGYDVHDSGATLFVDGKHIRSICEERLSRRKYEGDFPFGSIDYCLGDIKKEDIDIVAFDPQINLIEENNNLIRSLFPNAKLWFVSHHLCHAASSIFTSPFNSGSFLTIDGAGSAIWDFADRKADCVERNSIGYFDKNKRIFNFHKINISAKRFTVGADNQPCGTNCGTNIFGDFYGSLSNWIYEQKVRMMDNMDYDKLPEKSKMNAEGKVMGLSSYGKFDIESIETPYLKSTEYSKEFLGCDNYEFGYPIVNFYYLNLITRYLEYNKFTPEQCAYYLQKHYEDALTYWVKELRKDYLTEDVCFAGGCFLNISANTLLKPFFKNIHIPPFTDDSGIHFGAAAWASYRCKEVIQIPHNIALLGKSYTDKDIEEAIGFKDLRNIGEIKYNKYKDFDELCEIVTKHLEDNKIVAWFQGRSEAGPRALGSRSILMNPSKKENKDIMNSRVKHREYWRPFAGITLEGRGYDSPYMLYSEQVLTDDVPAITHEDNTCRMQTVNDELNPRMCDLLRKLENPVLLNTSFNDNGEPIVESPKDAIMAFKNMDIDYLVMGNYLIS